MPTKNFNIKGLTSADVLHARKKFGENKLRFKKEHPVIDSVKSVLKEPMVILLLITSILYFVLGETADGIFLSVAIVLVAGISLFQDSRSRIALDKLKDLSQPKCKVIRDGELIEILTSDLVIGDSLMVEEGAAITADATIVHSNDFSVNESILTGESMPVVKDKDSEDHFIYLGTSVASGLAIATVTAIGNDTKLGKIGESLENISKGKTPLETQISNFVRKMVIAGAIVFAIVWAVNYFNSGSVIDSLLKALTLAMSILPEEIPVAFTTFMALGAWRLMKLGIVVKQIKTVETLGSATVICLDKTGTITENKMSLAKIFTLESGKVVTPSQNLTQTEREMLTFAMWASEPIPFDAMEIALHRFYGEMTVADQRPEYRMIHEYPLSGKPPMMTHIFENSSGERIISAKGAPEALLAVSNLKPTDKDQIIDVIRNLGNEGYRVLAVASAEFTSADFPKLQQEFEFTFRGLVAFYDPPKHNIANVFQEFYAAGISVKIITGDNTETTSTIARQVGLRGFDQSLTGNELLLLSDEQLRERVQHINLFTRMFPEAKLKIINALKANNQIVAMTGDGVNDGPALKAAHIGIAMGTHGTDIAKQAASLILIENDLAKMVDAVAMGRKIYANLKKAIQYIISIHIPIILTVLIPLALGWIYPNIFSPIHVIFLELIMGPTCSIVYENEPLEKNTMLQKPRLFTSTFFSWKELSLSSLQGLAIAMGTLFTYQYSVSLDYGEDTTRTMVFTVLMIANIVLTLVNRSFFYSVLTTLRYKNSMVPIIIFASVLLLAIVLFVPPVRAFFEFDMLTANQLLFSIGVGMVSVLWFEIIKMLKRNSQTCNKDLLPE